MLWSLVSLTALWISWGSYRAGMRRADQTIDERGGMSPARAKAARDALEKVIRGSRQ